MLHIIYGNELHKTPLLSNSMFRHRAVQFKERLGWDVCVDDQGREKDEYDTLNPMYLIWETGDGSHGGSMRFLPTTAETMINDKFTQLLDGEKIRSPFIWECTRFCLAPKSEPDVSWKLLMGTLELSMEHNLDYLIGVFDRRMLRVYRRIGWAPKVIGQDDVHGSITCAGLWPVTEVALERLRSRGGLAQSPNVSGFQKRPVPLHLPKNGAA